MGLQSEAVTYPSEVDPRASLFRCGATADECAFLVQHYTPGERGKRGHWGGERIELNAMDSQQFLDWLEQKLHEVGVEKFVPDAQTLAVAYQHQVRKAKLQQIIDTALQTLPTDVEIPAKLGDIVRAAITNTAVSWDEALWHVCVNPIVCKDNGMLHQCTLCTHADGRPSPAVAIGYASQVNLGQQQINVAPGGKNGTGAP